MTHQPTVALLGIGTMGAGMARNIAAAGLPLRVWNRTREKADALADVATVAGTVKEAVSGADVVVTMLYDADSVAATMEEARGHLADDAVWLQQSTVGVAGTERLAELAADLGVAMVDAPVLGTRKPAEDGALVVLASGPEHTRDRVAPVLDAIGSKTLWIGEVGAGSRLKLAANAWVFTVVEGVAESLALTRELGLDPALFLETIKGGALDAPYVQVKGGAMLEGSFDPAFALGGALKDAELILEAAGGVGLDLGLLPGIRAHFARAVEAGHGDQDMAATWLEH
ncbi:NAD(P)-dependent oxidoreductase [Nocardioides panaciterrulae]|uniref:3-hydroxyisobutyrate dehydrogenase n=1 Tax=Nocardioides panaciterrulae TaxID=661492 RepID=A0A7Y9E6U8_9ACTN|nr:NAD(P)-dependent oxidoreductase [Nocardioides panaciterrulae]NYD41956.1 3-hydroxyisobutyrate dehydrogenase [Nocardioides panaciterrulae]